MMSRHGFYKLFITGKAPKRGHHLPLSPLKGFSLIEVLVALMILMFVLAFVTHSHLNTVQRMEHTGQNNEIQDKIRAELNALRKEALRWQCLDGTACTGLAKDRDTPMRYETGHCDQADPLSESATSSFPPSSGEIATGINNLKIDRIVVINERQLDVTYTSSVDGKSITTSTSIVPEAMNWCG